MGLEVRHTTVPIDFVNLPEDLELIGAPAAVEMTVEGPRLILPFQIQEAIAVVELNNLGPGTHHVPVRVQLPSTVTLKAVQPHEVQVVLEERVRRRLPVTVSIDGVSPGVTVRVINAQPEEIDVFGSSSAVAEVQTLLARVDYRNEKSSAVVVPVDIDGVWVDGVVLSSETVQVTLEIQDVQQTDDAQPTEETREAQETEEATEELEPTEG